MNKKEILVASFALLAVLLFVFSNLQLLSIHNKNISAIETVKSQLANAKSGLVSYPVPDLSITFIFSIASFAAGIAAGAAAIIFLSKKQV